MTQDDIKKAVAEEAVAYTLSRLDDDSIVGIGTGSTANFFIDALAKHKGKLAGTVASSEVTAERLKNHGIPVYELNSVNEVTLYVDGADEVNPQLQLIKGGGGALTQEKIVAAVACEFVCIVDSSKWVSHLGSFPLPIEVIPMARGHVGRELVKLGGDPVWREGFITDNGNMILDVYGLYPIGAVRKLEESLNNITGVVTNGLFALRPADLLLLGSEDRIQHIRAES